MINETIDRYINEGKVTKFNGNVQQLIKKGKVGTYNIDDVNVKVTKTSGIMIFDYPSDAYEITMDLVDASDKMGLSYQQIGLRSKGNMKFIIEL